MSDVTLTVEWETRGGKQRVKHVRVYVSSHRARTDGDVTFKLTEAETDALLSSYVSQLRGRNNR